jgi:general secretion pathway protein D
MKKIVSLLFAICLVSCSQPKPQPQPPSHAQYAPVNLDDEPMVAPGTEVIVPRTNTTTTTVTKAETHPAGEREKTVTVTKETTATPPGGKAYISNSKVTANNMEPVAPEGVTVTGPGGVQTTTSTVPNPFARPAQPAIPANAAPAPGAAGTTTASSATSTNDPIIPEMSINFHAQPIDGVLQTYADLVHKILLRSPNIPATATITLVQQVPVTRTELIHALDAELALNNIAMVPVGEKFIKVVLLPEAGGVGGKINDLNESSIAEFGPYETRVVQLKYTKPSQLVPVLQQFTKTPAAVLPIEDSGMLVLRDTSENVRRMMEMIDRLDVTVQNDIESAVIPIKYALASDIANALNSLSGSGGGGSIGGGSSGSRGSLGTSRTTGSGNARSGYGNGGIGGGGLGGNSGFSSQGGLGGNSGFSSQGGIGGGGAASPSFADRVKNLISTAAGGGKGEFQVLGQTKIIADERMNALLVFANHQDMEMVKDVVKKLDVVLAQVLIEAIIMEVTLDNSKTIGVSAAQQPIGGANHAFLGGYNNGQNFFPFSQAQQGGSNSFPGNFTSTLSPNMFSYWGKVGSFDLALQAAQNDSRVNVLSRPRIQTSHGVEADLFVGSTIPYVDSTTAGAYGGTGVYNSYQQQQVGITLKVKPLINPDGLVVMDIYQEASVQGPPSTAVTINGTPVPIINQRQASATVAVKDRDTIILGGMISTSQTKTKSGVPYLKDIPLLGNIFRSNANTEERVELIVLLRPTVLPTPEAAAAVANVERMKLPGVRRAETEIHAEEASRLKQAERELNDSRTNGATMPEIDN